MPLEFPKNRKEITDRMKNDVRAELGPNSNPFLRNSALGSLIFGMAGRIFDFFSQLKFLLLNMFPDTATGDFLTRWGSYVKIGKLPASIATGQISIGGIINIVTPTTIPDGTPFQSTTQAQYISVGASIVTTQAVDNIELVRNGEDITVTTVGAHLYVAGLIVVIEGALEPEYNGSFEILTIPAADQFTYKISTTPISPASGDIIGLANLASVFLESIDFGTVANLNSGEPVSLINPISGVNNAGNVQFAGIVGGEDVESDDSFRARILDRYQNPVSFYNVAQIEQKVKTLAGVTRVLVQEITPEPGDITVFFLKDNDPNIIPSLNERVLVKEKILEIKPADVDAGPGDPPNDPVKGSILVPPLKTLEITFAFTALEPKSPSLEAAIRNNLEQLFRGGNNIGEDMEQFVYDCVIADAFDSAGNQVKSFTLSSPGGVISVGADTIAVLEKVTFNF